MEDKGHCGKTSQQKFDELTEFEKASRKLKYSREVPYDVNIEDLLTELLEYMEDRQDIEDGDYGVPKPNKEMRLASDIHQALYQLERTPTPLHRSRSEGDSYCLDA